LTSGFTVELISSPSTDHIELPGGLEDVLSTGDTRIDPTGDGRPDRAGRA